VFIRSVSLVAHDLVHSLVTRVLLPHSLKSLQHHPVSAGTIFFVCFQLLLYHVSCFAPCHFILYLLFTYQLTHSLTHTQFFKHKLILDINHIFLLSIVLYHHNLNYQHYLLEIYSIEFHYIMHNIIYIVHLLII
jgi:hypothetical protein